MKRIDRLTNLLMYLNTNKDFLDFDEKNRAFLSNTSCKEIALALQKLLASGITPSELYRMWQRNKKVLPDQTAKLRAELPANHILKRALAEHEIILCFIADLDDANLDVQKLDYASSSSLEIRRLAQLAGSLVHSQQHREREQQIIYPELRLRNYSDLLKITNEQHRKIGTNNRKLKDLVWQIDSTKFNVNFDDFKRQLAGLVNYLVPTVRKHIFLENSVIFPLALDIIDDQKVWKKMKEVSDQIGYCI